MSLLTDKWHLMRASVPEREQAGSYGDVLLAPLIDSTRRSTFHCNSDSGTVCRKRTNSPIRETDRNAGWDALAQRVSRFEQL